MKLPSPELGEVTGRGALGRKFKSSVFSYIKSETSIRPSHGDTE